MTDAPHPPVLAKATTAQQILGKAKKLRGVALRLRRPRNYARVPTAKRFLQGHSEVR